MSEPRSAIERLSGKLCPWLRQPLETLEQAHRTGRLGHAWLITGPEGIGKINLALVFTARLLTGRSGSEMPPALGPAEAVAAMRDRRLAADHHPDLHRAFPEEGKHSISVEQIRDVTDALALTSFGNGAKLVVIEPAEAMTRAAANALLKTLEEPSRGSYLLLISHQPGRLPSTIRSRCQTLAVKPPASAATWAWLGVGDGERPGGQTFERAAPIRLAQYMADDTIGIFNDLEEKLSLICQNKLDPQSLADEWQKKDLNGLLGWLVGRLQSGIRERFSAGGPQRPMENSVTDSGRRSVDNVCETLSLDTLFRQLAAAERLRDRAGGGINEDLALRVLLQGFAPK